MTKALVLGGRGMIGAGVVSSLTSAGIEVLKTSRNPASPADLKFEAIGDDLNACLLYTSPSPRDYAASRMPSSA